MYFQHVALIALLATLGVEGAAVQASSQATSSATTSAISASTSASTSATTSDGRFRPYVSTRPAEPTNFPESGSRDLEHIKVEVDEKTRKCIVKIKNVYGCTGEATVGNYNEGLCEPTWNEELPLVKCANTIGVIIASRGDKMMIQYKNKYSQEVRWTVDHDSPDLDDGKPSWSTSTLPRFKGSFPHGPNNNYWKS